VCLHSVYCRFLFMCEPACSSVKLTLTFSRQAQDNIVLNYAKSAMKRNERKHKRRPAFFSTTFTFRYKCCCFKDNSFAFFHVFSYSGFKCVCCSKKVDKLNQISWNKCFTITFSPIKMQSRFFRKKKFKYLSALWVKSIIRR
jgi:hypothetical protein